MLQLSGNTQSSDTLAGLRRGDAAILERIDLPEGDAARLMELGFIPGARIIAGRSAPGGDPRIFQVDGSEIALRSETAARLAVRPDRKVVAMPRERERGERAAAAARNR